MLVCIADAYASMSCFPDNFANVDIHQVAEATAMASAMQRPPQDGMGMGMSPNMGLAQAPSGNGQMMEEMSPSPGLNVPMAGKKVMAKQQMEKDDEWGNEELGDDLLPM